MYSPIHSYSSVSYTHLDVYKRQGERRRECEGEGKERQIDRQTGSSEIKNERYRDKERIHNIVSQRVLCIENNRFVSFMIIRLQSF